MKSKILPKCKAQILSQPFFGNRNIQFERKPLFITSFSKSGITKISHIWDCNTKTFIRNEELVRKLVFRQNWIAEITKIKKAIPRQYIALLHEQEQQEIESMKKDIYINSQSQICISKTDHFKILIHNELNLSMVNKITAVTVRPKAEIKWNDYFHKELPWNEIWKNFRNSDIAITNRMEEFHWKCTHRIIYTESKLHLMNRSNGLCHMCNSETETLPHLFFNCAFSRQLLDIIYTNLYNNTVFDTTDPLGNIDEEIMILGDTSNTVMTPITNTIIITTKWAIWKVRNIKKFQNKITSPLSTFEIIKNTLKENISLYLKITAEDKKRLIISRHRLLYRKT